MDIESAAVLALAAHLKTKLSAEYTILDEFPEPGATLSYPTTSIVPAKAHILLKQPYPYNSVDVPNTVATVEARYVVADVNIPIQLDLWFMSKDQRRYYLATFMNSLIQNPARAGDLNLNLDNHFSVHANYQMSDSIDTQDTNTEALVSEYRAKVSILCTTELVATKEEYKLLSLYLHTNVYMTKPRETAEITTVFEKEVN